MRTTQTKKRHTVTGYLAPVFLFLFALITVQCASADKPFPDPPAEKPAAHSGQATAVLAGGCFWGMEGVFERLRGVTDVVSGYAGGDAATATYMRVSSGKTGHAESVRIQYDPARITYGTILKVFFDVAHNPTQLNSQGPDHGTQYRSVIFYVNEEQKKIAEAYIRTIDQARVYPRKIVTQVTPFRAFYPAEEYHQDFMRLNPTYPYIVYWDAPKVKHLEQAYPNLIKAQ